MDIQGQPSNRSKTKVWGRSGEGGGVQGMFWMSPMVQKEKASNILH